MDEAESVTYRSRGSVGEIVLNRPDVANAFDLPAVDALAGAIDRAAADEVRAILVSGAGSRFCAGGDVASFVAAEDRSSYLAELASRLERVVRRLSLFPAPVVVAVHGAVAGGGWSFLLNADLVLAARSTRFVLAYSSIGLTPDCGVSYLLPRVVGQQRALQLAVGGHALSADTAEQWGLVAEVVDDEALPRSARAVVDSLANEATEALREAKRLLRSSWNVTREQSAADEAATIARMIDGDDARSRIARFARP